MHQQSALLQLRSLAFLTHPAARKSKCFRAATARAQHHQRDHAAGVVTHGSPSAGQVQQPCGTPASRRSAVALLPGVAAAVAAAALLEPQPAASAALADDRLPKGYQDLSSRLVKALREAIETDMGDATEREVRRKADGAKGLVREWLANWRDAPLIAGSDSHRQLVGTIQELGQFYQKNGQRARMSTSAGQALLRRLDAAAVTLPP